MPAILLVVGDAGAPTTGDAFLKSTLEGLGHTVTYVSDETAENVTGFDGVVISESVTTATLGAKYDTVAIPVITHETGNVNDLRLFTAEAGTIVGSATTIDIVDSTHPIVDGPFGSFSGAPETIFSAATNLGHADDAVGDFPAGVDIIAVSPATSTRKVILAAESGADLTSGTAPAKRAFLFPTAVSQPNLNATGTAILKNAYAWAFAAAEKQTIFIPRRIYVRR